MPSSEPIKETLAETASTASSTEPTVSETPSTTTLPSSEQASSTEPTVTASTTTLATVPTTTASSALKSNQSVLAPLALSSRLDYGYELIRAEQLIEEDLMESKMGVEAKVECNNTSCSSSSSFQKRCPIFIGFPPSCDVPCHLEGCKIEYHRNIMCTLWACHEKTTTTPSPMPTPTPMPTPSSSVENGLVTSVIFNVLFIIGFSLIAGKYYKTRRANQNLTNSTNEDEEDIDDIVQVIRRSTPIFTRQSHPPSSQVQNQDVDSINVAPSAPPPDDSAGPSGTAPTSATTGDSGTIGASGTTGDSDSIGASGTSFLELEKLKHARKKFKKFWNKKYSGTLDNDVENPKDD